MSLREEIETQLGNHPRIRREAVVIRSFTANYSTQCGAGTWYLTEYDGKDTAFGYVTGLAEDEWGYVSISELEALHIGGSIPRIECDLHFDPVSFSKIRALEKVER